MTQVSGIGSGPSAFAAAQSAFGTALHGAQAKSPSANPNSVASDAEDTAERAALKQAAKSFEAIFTRQLLGSMRQAGQGEGIGDSSAVGQFREMADANMANDLANRGGLGIAQMILQQLDRKP